ncbi:hypothetical protein Q3G72_026232 [Acer saccharum]|nr:hypothetical protein Q3G72_026232 [Acer saccharum]
MNLSQFVTNSLNLQWDEEDMVVLVRNFPTEFKENYIQMQAAKKSQAQLPSQVTWNLVACTFLVYVILVIYVECKISRKSSGFLV